MAATHGGFLFSVLVFDTWNLFRILGCTSKRNFGEIGWVKISDNLLFVGGCWRFVSSETSSRYSLTLFDRWIATAEFAGLDNDGLEICRLVPAAPAAAAPQPRYCEVCLLAPIRGFVLVLCGHARFCEN